MILAFSMSLEIFWDICFNFILKHVKKNRTWVSLKNLVLNFYHGTEPDGFDALCELERQIAPGSDKGKIVQKIREEQEFEPESVQF